MLTFQKGCFLHLHNFVLLMIACLNTRIREREHFWLGQVNRARDKFKMATSCGWWRLKKRSLKLSSRTLIQLHIRFQQAQKEERWQDKHQEKLTTSYIKCKPIRILIQAPKLSVSLRRKDIKKIVIEIKRMMKITSRGWKDPRRWWCAYWYYY